MLAICVRIYLVYVAAALAVWLFDKTGGGRWRIPEVAYWREPSLILVSSYLLVLGWFLARSKFTTRLRVDPRSPWLIAATVLVGCWAARILLLQGFEASRDEQLVVFDAAIFGSGRLFAMLPQEWIPDAAALNREFMLPIAHPVGWVSGYLPINAAIRAGFRVIGLAEWASPAMAAASILLIWSIARHLWPDDRGAASVAVIMLAGSGQFLLTGMTTYAMTAHLLLNLIWLRLFLQGRGWADALAVVTGFMATGLHQPVFHPLFAGPLIALLAWRREFRRFVSFGIAYLAICVFWYLWPQWLAGQITARAGVSSEHLQSLSYLDRLTEVFHVDWSNLFLQIYNLLALVVWQHLLLGSGPIKSLVRGTMH